MKDTHGYALPIGWSSGTIGDLFALVRGVSFPSGAQSKQFKDGLIACLRTTNVQATVEWEDLWFIPRMHVRRSAQLVGLHDILISTANSFNLVGKVALVTALPTEATLGAFIGLVRVPAQLSSSFVYYQMCSYDAQAAIRSRASTTTNISNVSMTKLSTVELKFPPLPEQHRIVAEIETQFTRLDASLAALERVRANLKRYRAATLAAACEGRLVPTEAELARVEGQDYESGEALLKRVLADRQARTRTQPAGAAGLAGDDRAVLEPASLPALPDGWTWTTLGQILTTLRNGLSVKPTAEDGVRILRISSVRPLAVDLTDVRYLEADGPSYPEFTVEPGDLLFIRYNGNPELVGACAALKLVPRLTLHPDKLIRVRLAHPLLPEVVAVLLSAGYSRQFLRRRVRTTAGQAGISGGDLRQTPVALPPLAEQHRIVAEVERRLSLLDKLEAVVDDAQKRATALRQSILKRAFEGKLVPQDPTDEPADVLLERIRADRSAVSANGTAPRRAGRKKVRA